MPDNAPSPLVISVANEIVQIIESMHTPVGERLVERSLSDRLKVSRSPVRQALSLLESEGVVRRSDGGGYVVGHVSKRPVFQAPTDEDQLHRKIAADWREGRLPDRVTENFLLREYECTRTELNETLRRISIEGWIDRRPGYGWKFLPMPGTAEVEHDSSRFRAAIEPAAILEPTFVLNADALKKCRVQQARLLDGQAGGMPALALFDMDSAFHEAVMSCSNNSFFIDSLRRVERLRRLSADSRNVDFGQELEKCRMHIRLIDLLLEGHREAASALMREHLLWSWK